MLVEGTVEEPAMGASGEAVMMSLEMLGGGGASVAAASEVAAVVGGPESVAADGPSRALDMAAVGEEAVGRMATSPPAAATGSTDGITFGSDKSDSVCTFVDVAAELSSLGAETVSEVVVEGKVTELEVTEMLGVMGSEEMEGTEAVVGASVGEMVVRVVGMAWEGGSVVAASGTVLSSSSITFVGVVAAAVGLIESVHISVSEGVTVLEEGTIKPAESRDELETVGAGAADGALVGVAVSASWICVSSFSGVLRPDAVGGGPGFRTGFGSKAGFPADSCADTLGRI